MSITRERAKTHGDYMQQAALAQDLKRRIRAESPRLSPQQQEAIEMICVKIARIVCGNPSEPDHWIDIQGYAELANNQKRACREWPQEPQHETRIGRAVILPVDPGEDMGA